jgi:hypothetical protein
MPSRNARIVAYPILVLAGAVLTLNPSQPLELAGLLLAAGAFTGYVIEWSASFRDR